MNSKSFTAYYFNQQKITYEAYVKKEKGKDYLCIFNALYMKDK